MRYLAATVTYHPNGWETTSTILGAVGIALGIIAAVSFAVMYFRGSYAKATIETLKQNNDALLERVDLLDDRATECVARADALSRENDMLKRMVTGADAIKALQDAVTDMTATLAAAHHETIAMTTQALNGVEHLHQHAHGRDGDEGHAHT